MNHLVVHSKAGCPFCVKAKEWLTEKGIQFIVEEHDDEAEKNQFYDKLGLVGNERTLPQIIYTEEYAEYRIEGYSQLVISGIESLFTHAG